MTEVAINVDEVLGHIGIFFLVNRTTVTDKVSRFGIGKHIRHNCLVASVDEGLCVLSDVHIAETCRRAFDREEDIEYERILSVIIPTTLCKLRIVLGSKQHLVIHELAVVKDRSATDVLLVVPIDNGRFVGGVHRVIVDILVDIKGSTTEFACELRVSIN